MTKPLLKYRAGDTDLFYTLEDERDFRLINEMDLDDHIKNILKRGSEYSELIDLNSKLRGLSGKAILSAHGNSKDNKWVYSNEGLHLVQDWIDEMDGKYAALLLACCNPDAHEISSQRSAVLAVNYDQCEILQSLGEGKFELYLPGIGYIDSYTADHQRGQLERLIGNESS